MRSNLETIHLNWSSAQYQEYFSGQAIKFGRNSLSTLGGWGGDTQSDTASPESIHVCKIRILTYPGTSACSDIPYHHNNQTSHNNGRGARGYRPYPWGGK